MTEHSQTLASDRGRPAALESVIGAELDSPPRTSSPQSLVLGLLWLESVLFLAFVAQRIEMSVYMGLHLGLCAMTAAFGLWWARVSIAADDSNDATVLVLQLVAWTTLAGPFGSFIAAALLVPKSGAARSTDATDETAAPIARRSDLTRLELLHGSLLDRRLQLGHAHAIRPLLDVMIEGIQIEKLDALSLISKRYASALAPALRRALEDNDASVRVLAATVMAQQHNTFTKRIGAIQAIAKAAPDSSNHWSALGQAHLDYAASGLLEASRADAEVSHAVGHLARAAALEPDNAMTQVRLSADEFAAADGQATIAAHDQQRDATLRVTQYGA